jgi:hypothetical protein
MELPEDVLQLVREYARPSERYKVGKSVLAILERHHSLGPIRKELQTAIRFHYETFRKLFLDLEKTYAELTVASDAVIRNDTIDTESELQLEYSRKRKYYTYVEYDLLNLLYTVGRYSRM